MANGTFTPLQLNTVAGMMNNTGIKSLPTALTAAIAAYNGQTVISNWLAAVNYYQAQSFRTESTLDQLLSIGSGAIPALGNSIPTVPLGNFPYLRQEYLPGQSDASTLDPYGFADLVQQTGNAYLGIYNDTRDLGRFCQGFTAVQSYINLTNSLINSTNNAATYLGPTFSSMNSLVTNNISDLVNTTAALTPLAVDIANQGQLVSTKRIEFYGTPAGLLAQIAQQGRITADTTPALSAAMLAQGLTKADITNLVTLNLQSLTNRNGLTPNQFDKLQRLAYQALGKVSGSDLQDILDILQVSTPNIGTVADLLNPIIMFPNSYQNLATPTPNGPETVYQNNGSVNMNLVPVIDGALPTPSGCDELAKIIPPDQAVANKALQVSLQQISDLPRSSWPRLAETIRTFVRLPWQADRMWLENDVVAAATSNANSSLVPALAILTPTTVFYRAIQDVPAGINITDTAYWQEIVPGGLNTMVDLADINALTAPVASATTSYIDTNIATGSGENGTITTCDVLGTAIDYNDLATLFGTVSAGIASLQTAGALGTLNTAYTNIAAAANDAAVLAEIANANSAITTLSANPVYAATVSSINTAWVAIATYLNQELTYQVRAGLNYFQLSTGEQTSILAFCQLLAQYGRDATECGPYSFLEDIADTATLAGQAMIGSLREGENQLQLAAASMPGPDIKPNTQPPVPPARVIPVAVTGITP